MERRLEQDEKSKDEQDKKNEQKNESKEVTKEAIEEEFGDKYVVSAKIYDELADKLIGTEGFIGYPLMAFNKETKEFVLLGTTQNGKLKEAEMMRSNSIVNVNQYNFDGSIVRETTITGMMYLPPQNKDAVSMELNEYGEIEINKIVNARSENPQAIPIDTNQTMPTTNEIEEMKENGEGMEEIMEIIEEMKNEDIIDDIEETEVLEEISNNGKSVEEDKEYLERIAKKKEIEQESKQEPEEDLDRDDEDDGMPPMADPFNPNNRSRW